AKPRVHWKVRFTVLLPWAVAWNAVYVPKDTVVVPELVAAHWDVSVTWTVKLLLVVAAWTHGTKAAKVAAAIRSHALARRPPSTALNRAAGTASSGMPLSEGDDQGSHMRGRSAGGRGARARLVRGHGARNRVGDGIARTDRGGRRRGARDDARRAGRKRVLEADKDAHARRRAVHRVERHGGRREAARALEEEVHGRARLGRRL